MNFSTKFSEKNISDETFQSAERRGTRRERVPARCVETMLDRHQSAADCHDRPTSPRVRRSNEQRAANPRLPLRSGVRRFRVLEKAWKRAVARPPVAVAARPRPR